MCVKICFSLKKDIKHFYISVSYRIFAPKIKSIYYEFN